MHKCRATAFICPIFIALLCGLIFIKGNGKELRLRRANNNHAASLKVCLGQLHLTSTLRQSIACSRNDFYPLRVIYLLHEGSAYFHETPCV